MELLIYYKLLTIPFFPSYDETRYFTINKIWTLKSYFTLIRMRRIRRLTSLSLFGNLSSDSRNFRLTNQKKETTFVLIGQSTITLSNKYIF